MNDVAAQGYRRITTEILRISTAVLALTLPLALLPAQAAAEPGAPDLDSVVLSLNEENSGGPR
jgi:hypothetical protein